MADTPEELTAPPQSGTPAPPPVSKSQDAAAGPLTESELLERHSALVYNLAFRLLGNEQDAEDLAQDAMIRALKALPRFRGECQVTTWLYRITLNTWKNRVRSEKRRGLWKRVTFGLFSDDPDEETSLAEKLPSGEPALDAGLETEDKASAVQKALMELEPENRAVLVLRDLEGQSYEEIAVQLGLPEGTVKSRLNRGREALKKRLKKCL